MSGKSADATQGDHCGSRHGIHLQGARRMGVEKVTGKLKVT